MLGLSGCVGKAEDTGQKEQCHRTSWLGGETTSRRPKRYQQMTILPYHPCDECMTYFAPEHQLAKHKEVVHSE